MLHTAARLRCLVPPRAPWFHAPPPCFWMAVALIVPLVPTDLIASVGVDAAAKCENGKVEVQAGRAAARQQEVSTALSSGAAAQCAGRTRCTHSLVSVGCVRVE